MRLLFCLNNRVTSTFIRPFRPMQILKKKFEIHIIQNDSATNQSVNKVFDFNFNFQPKLKFVTIKNQNQNQKSNGQLKLQS